MVGVEFESSGSLIKGYFFPAGGDKAIATVLFLQGFPGVEGDELICQRLAQKNVNVLTFNYRGTFGSEGHFSFSNAVADIGATLQFLQKSQLQKRYAIDPDKIVLGGWSFGSGIVLAGAARFPKVKKIFCLSGRDFGKEAQRIAEDPDYAKVVANNLAAIRAPAGPIRYQDDLQSDLVENEAKFNSQRLASRLKERDLLLVGSWDDEVSAIEDHILPLYRLLKEHNAKVSIKAFQDDHEFSKCKDTLVDTIIGWLSD